MLCLLFYEVVNVIAPANDHPPVSMIEVQDSCVQVNVPVSIPEEHDNCAQLTFPEKDAVLGRVVR